MTPVDVEGASASRPARRSRILRTRRRSPDLSHRTGRCFRKADHSTCPSRPSEFATPHHAQTTLDFSRLKTCEHSVGSTHRVPSSKAARIVATPAKPSIVFAHGLWADGSCFSKVTPALQADGHQVISTQTGRTGSRRSRPYAAPNRRRCGRITDSFRTVAPHNVRAWSAWLRRRGRNACPIWHESTHRRCGRWPTQS